MATFISSIFLWLFLQVCILSLFYLQKGNAFQGTKIAETHHLQHYHTIQVSSLLPSTSCRPHTEVIKNKAYLKVVHKYGPCSPLNQERENASSNLTEILLQDQSRVKTIHSGLSKTPDRSDVKLTDAATLPAKSGSTLGVGNYIVTVGIGTPKEELSLVFDTGSSLTWIQCEPCVRYCHPQKEPIFNPAKSTSYSNISCASSLCNSLTSATGISPGCHSSTCVYGIIYADSSYSAGFFGSERLTLTSTDVFDNFYFGCGQNNGGRFGGTAGILGLGRDKLSLISQTAQKYNKIFSYCLPSSSSSSGFLTFGSSSPSKSTTFTPLLTLSNPRSNFYGLGLTGISVGGQKLLISSSVFSIAGTVIDSGTTITYLPPEAYSALRSAFRQLMSKYPMTKPFATLFDTCYDLSNYKNVSLPTIGFFFNGGVEVDVAAPGILFGPSPSQLCLAFAGNSHDTDLAILGNTQQKTLEVVYDVAGGRVGFAPGGCS